MRGASQNSWLLERYYVPSFRKIVPLKRYKYWGNRYNNREGIIEHGVESAVFDYCRPA